MILVTGSNGICGSAIFESILNEKYSIIYTDIKQNRNKNFVVADLTDLNSIKSLFDKFKFDTLIHFGGSSDPKTEWKDVLNNNITGTYNILNVAVEKGIKKIIFASTNHVMGMYEINNPLKCFSLPEASSNKEIIDNKMDVKPDSLYGVSKLFGENLCKFYSENFNVSCYIIRIGSIREKNNDHPYIYAEEGVQKGLWEKGSSEYKFQEKRLKSIWMSRRDFVHMIDKLLDYTDLENKYDIFYATSLNSRRFFDIETAIEKLDLNLKDNSEDVLYRDIYGFDNN